MRDPEQQTTKRDGQKNQRQQTRTLRYFYNTMNIKFFYTVLTPGRTPPQTQNNYSSIGGMQPVRLPIAARLEECNSAKPLLFDLNSDYI
ncbi:hypothetical protein BN874_60008 [Candidatus Contendobacter odensis Run_B_J11]|uniref:Uncharacterized protein n=1 Tax=Candidatus Contendobacter odensis Run_B_J11 TaxID=1400861 RepID=A0A7U7J5Q6_9GAMM|nr:hypothetical protein BN874_60008 [Candidatus Contendobacter odensis Run_B_J11]